MEQLHTISHSTIETGECDRGCCTYHRTTYKCSCGWEYSTNNGSTGYEELERVRRMHEHEVMVALLGLEVIIAK